MYDFSYRVIECYVPTPICSTISDSVRTKNETDAIAVCRVCEKRRCFLAVVSVTIT